MDLVFISTKLLTELKEKFSICEDEGFKPIPLDFEGAVIVFSETLSSG